MRLQDVGTTERALPNAQRLHSAFSVRARQVSTSFKPLLRSRLSRRSALETAHNNKLPKMCLNKLPNARCALCCSIPSRARASSVAVPCWQLLQCRQFPHVAADADSNSDDSAVLKLALNQNTT